MFKLLPVLLFPLAFLSACGGGDSSNVNTSQSDVVPDVVPPKPDVTPPQLIL